MGKYAEIEWTDHTFNPWWGCVRVSPACDNCYAETLATRFGNDLWGPHAPRRFFGETHWSEPLRWNAAAVAAGRRERVFCASMADVFERRDDLDAERRRLWSLVAATPKLDWLLLTKRPQHVASMVPWGDEWPSNVWLGTTVENQRFAEIRVPHLLAAPAKVRFLSCEPLLGAVDLSPWIRAGEPSPLHWIIAGGESGFGSRPMHPAWVRGLRDFADARGIAFHFKQWGNWAPAAAVPAMRSTTVQFPGASPVEMVRAAKKDAGRILDGSTHDGLPVDRN